MHWMRIPRWDPVGEIIAAAIRPPMPIFETETTSSPTALLEGVGFGVTLGTAPSGDFTGNLGSDGSKGFRSYSALSDLIFITSPQQMDSFNIAQGTGIFEFRRDFSTLPEANNIYATRKLNDAQIRLDRSTLALSAGTLYATAVDPSDVGIITMESGQFNVTASPLEGVGINTMRDAFDGYTLYDRAMARQEMARRGDPDLLSDYSPFISDFDRARLLGRAEELEAEGEPPSEQLMAQITNSGPQTAAYKRIVERVAEKYADRSDVRFDVTNRESVLRDTGNAMGRLEAQITPGFKQKSLTDAPRNTDVRREGLPGNRVLNAGAGSVLSEEDLLQEDATKSDQSTEDGPSEAEKDPGLSIKEMGEILRHRTEIGELSITDKTRLARTVKQGEEAIKEGRFFKAERRFDDALRINPGNPLLELARANAQIGAGVVSLRIADTEARLHGES